MTTIRAFCIILFCQLFALAQPAAALIFVTWNTATDVPVTASSYSTGINTVSFTLNFAPPTGTNLTMVNNTGQTPISGKFLNLSQGQAVTLSYNGVGYGFVANYYGGTGNDLVLSWAGHRVFSWGDNTYGQIGDGTVTQRNVMVPVNTTGVLGGKTILALSQSTTHCVALCSDGSLASWGNNSYGALGNGNSNLTNYPVAVSTAYDVSALYGKTVQAISSGNNYSLALCSDNTVLSWGYNASGQLGIRSTDNSNAPVQVDATSGVSALYRRTVMAVATGDSHSVAFCTDGAVVAWGLNSSGQLGNGTTSQSLVPATVNSVNGVSALYGKTVVAIAAGGNSTMALCSDGTIAAWGDGSSGQLGNGSTTPTSFPVAVNTASGVSALYGKTVTKIAAGASSCMALCTDGTLVAWGDNTAGQLGNNSTTSSSVPVLVNMESGTSALYGKTIVSISMRGGSSTALCSDGTVATWGDNGFGQLGNNTTNNSLVPQLALTTPLGVGERVMAPSVASGGAQSVVLVAKDESLPVGTTLAATAVGSVTATLNGTVNPGGTSTTFTFEYGTTTAYGTTVAGSPTTATGSSDAAVSAVLSGLAPMTTYHFRVKGVNVAGTAAGSDQTFTTLSNNTSLASLATSAGALSPSFSSGTLSYTAPGVDVLTNSVTVTPTLADSNASIAVNGASVISGGTVPVSLVYGLNNINVQVTAQDGVTKQSYTIGVTRATPSTITASFASGSDVPLTTGGLTATGITVNLFLNYAPTTGTNLMVVNNTGVPFINGTFSNLSQGQAVTLTYNGVAYKFVANYYGGTGNDLVLAWAANRAFAWGQNGDGQIGDGTSINRAVMVPVDATGVLRGKTILALSQGSSHSLALCSDGSLAAWGANYYGELGAGNNTSTSYPVAVSMASGVSALYGKTVVGVSAGYNFSVAVCSDGSVVTWGYNGYGQLGNNSTTDTNAPVLVNTTSGVSALYGKTVVAVAAGFFHAVALCSDGTVAAWGTNGSGQFGDGTGISSTVPVAVNTASGVSALYGKTVIAISVGNVNTMALCSDGTVAEWGNNTYGNLGDIFPYNKLVPTLVNTARGVSALYGKTVKSIAVGNYYSMALCTDGSVAAWGDNTNGNFGNNSTISSTFPVLVNTASGTSALYGKTVVSIGTYNNQFSASTALCSDGTVATWGANNYSQLGNNTTTNSLVPQLALTTPLTAGERVTTPSALNTNTQSLVLVAEPVATITTSATTNLGGTTATLNGTVNANNGLAVAVSFDYGLTTAYGSNVTASPASVSGGSNTPVSAVLTGLKPNTTYHFRVNAGAFTSSDQTFTTLPNNNANLASLTTTAGSLTPAFASGTTSYTVSVASAIASVTVSPSLADSNASVTVNGASVTSGSASAPVSLGYGANAINVLVTAQDGVTQQTYTLTVTRAAPATLAATYASASDVPLTSNGLTATGSTVNFTLNFAPATGANLTVVNNTGLGFINGTFSNLSQGQSVLLTYNGVAYNFVANYYGGTGNDLVLVWARNRVLACGYNGSGELGNSSNTSLRFPSAATATGVLAGKTVVALAAGVYHSLALCSDGTLAAWGDNTYGNLGDNTTTSRNAPVAVNTSSISALNGKMVVAIAAGNYSSMALCSDGTVAVWGDNTYGQLGNNTYYTNWIVPTAVNTASGVSALYGKKVVAISAGTYHNMALCSDGTVAAWGHNVSGQLGNNSTDDSLAPTAVNTVSGVSALSGKIVVEIAAGGNHCLALCSDGSVVTWGDNFYYQLGVNGTLNGGTYSTTPVAVNAANGTSDLYGKFVVAVTAGYEHNVALCADGTLVEWGYNVYGQLGNNSTTNGVYPLMVNTANGVSALYGKMVVGIAGGAGHTAVQCADGTIAAWGNNAYGQLGNGTNSASTVPVQAVSTALLAGERFIKVASGTNAFHTLALVASPPAAPTVTSVAASSITATSVTLNGTANANFSTTAVSFDYGLTTAYGSNVAATPATLSSGIATAVSTSLSGLTPETTYHFRVNGVSNVGASSGSDMTFTTLSTNASLSALVLNNGTLTPAFASGTTSYTATVPYLTNALTLTPTAAASAATLKINGVTIASGSTSSPLALNVGSNTFNVVVTAQDGSTTQTYTLTVTRQTTVLAASYNSAADVPLTMNGVTATGSTVNFTLNYAPATGTNLTVVNNTGPGFISGTFSNLSQGQAVTLSYNGVGYNFVANYYGGTGNDLVLVWANNRAFAWGSGGNGQIGDATTSARLVPVPVTASGVLAGKTIVALSAGGFHSLALCSDGTLAAWGDNSYGELGDNTTTQRAAPIAVNTSNGISALYGKTVVSIAAGFYHSMALCSDGTVAAWGLNSNGQLGDNSTINRFVPVAVSTASGVSALYGKTATAIATGFYHSMALCSDGTVASWGYNTYGQLGNSSTTDSYVPVAVNITNGVSALYGKAVVGISAGGYHNLALCSDGSMASWGQNVYGGLGDNTTTNRMVPVAVNAASGISALYGKSAVAIAAGQYHDLALCSDGTLVSWGYNASGQLGDNTLTNRNAPVAVNTANGVSALYGRSVVGLACGYFHSAVQCADGTISTWGNNGIGQLGNNSLTSRSVPVLVISSSLAVGESFIKVTSGASASHNLGLAVAPPAAPTVTTLAATGITATTVTLNGTVNANNSTTAVSFDYGPTSGYGTNVAATPASLSSGSATAVSASLTGLTPGTTYHFRVNGVSGAGTANGSDLTFTTLSNNAALSALALNNGTLSPVFASGTTSYTATVAYPITSITLRPTLANANASVTVNGQSVASGSASSSIPLSIGNNTLTTVVTAQDGITTQTYTVTVTRVAPSTNAALASLLPSVGSLSPVFASGTTSYSLTVPFSTTSMTLTPTVADSTATLKVNGAGLTSGSASSPLALNLGNNTVSVLVTAQNGISTQTYTITVTRPALAAAWNTLSDVPLVSNGFVASGNVLGVPTLNFAPVTGTNLMVVNNTGLGFITGTFSNLSQGQPVTLRYNGLSYNFVANYYGGTGNDLVLQWAANRALAWGYNTDSELGDGTTTQRSSAVPVTATGVLAGKTILSVATGSKHSLALCSDGTLAAWGANTNGQLGDNTTTNRSTPVAVNATSGVSALFGKTVIAIAAGQNHSLALCSDGTVAAWGDNQFDQLGDTTTTQRNAPVQVNNSFGVSSLFSKTVVAIAVGARHNLALCSDGSVMAWGSNTSGQLGDNTTTPRSAAVPVNAASGVSALNGKTVVAVSAGGLHSLALCTDGTVLAWGNDTNGELGDDNAAQFYTNSPVAVAVSASAGSALFGKSVVSIIAGYAHNLAQCSDGTLAAWGSNAFGQLGDTTTNNGYVPVTVSTASGVSALNGKTVATISAGARHSLAQCMDGTLAAWGLDSSGQLGNASTTSSSAPVAVSTSPLAVGEVFIRSSNGVYALHTLALVAVPPPPFATVTTLAATGVGNTSVTLNATVNANSTTTAASFDYGTTTAYGTTLSATPATVTGGSSTAVSVTLTGLASGTTYHFRVNGMNSSGTSNGSDLTFTTLPNALQNWRQTNFGTMASSGTAADAADFDNDGIPNLIEWACNLSPTTRSTLPATVTANGTSLTYTYSRSTGAASAGGSFIVEWSNTLAAGSWNSSGVVQTVLSDDGTTQQVQAVIPITTESAKFVHLSVTPPP